MQFTSLLTWPLIGLASFIVGMSALTVVFYALSYLVPKASFPARSLAYIVCLSVCGIYGALASIALRLAGKEQISQWATARAFKWTMMLATGVTFEVDDPNDYLGKTRPAIFIGNHQTELDILMLGCMFPKYCSVTSKKSLKYYPFLGWFMALSGTVFIDRKNSRDAREAMQGAAKEIRERRQSVYMFPEGTRSYAKDPIILPFKKGAFHLAVQAGVPIVPVVVANYSHVLSFKKLVFNAGNVPCKVLAPIPTENLTPADVDELARTTRELMLGELVTLTAKAQGRSVAAKEPVAVPAVQRNGIVKATGVDDKKI